MDPLEAGSLRAFSCPHGVFAALVSTRNFFVSLWAKEGPMCEREVNMRVLMLVG